MSDKIYDVAIIGAGIIGLATALHLSKININKAPGPDGIPSWLLRDLSHILAGPVSSIWNSSLQNSFIPSIWKCANTCALPKVPNPININKHLRPISLTPILSKGLEFFVRDWFVDVIKQDIDDLQFGSQKNCSTILALAFFIHMWLLNSEKKDSVTRILLLDFSKAFDLVDHHILMKKINTTNMPEFIKCWIHSFLENRKQRVKIGNNMSSWVNMNAGVPQGTLLGPVCFLLHINDLKTACDSIKYVDDTTIWENCTVDESSSNIQTAANDAVKWCQENNMKLNTEKTKEMMIYFGKKQLTFPPIQINSSPLENVENSKVLGVVLNNKLKWGDYIDYISTKASKRLYFLRLLKRANINPSDIITVYCSTIRSILEYACEVWHPGLTKQLSNQLELIQKRAFNIAYPDISYNDAIKMTNTLSLYQRREDRCKQFFIDICKEDHKLHHLLPPLSNTTHLRSKRHFTLPKVKTNRVKTSPILYGVFKYQDCL